MKVLDSQKKDFSTSQQMQLKLKMEPRLEYGRLIHEHLLL